MSNNILSYVSGGPPTGKASSAATDARAKFRAKIEAAVPSDINEAETKLSKARAVKTALLAKLAEARAGLDDDPTRKATAEERALAEEIRHVDGEIDHGRRALRGARERFADQTRKIILDNIRQDAPAMIAAALQLESLAGVLDEADSFARRIGIDPPGYSQVLFQIGALRSFAAQLRGK